MVLSRGTDNSNRSELHCTRFELCVLVHLHDLTAKRCSWWISYTYIHNSSMQRCRTEDCRRCRGFASRPLMVPEKHIQMRQVAGTWWKWWRSPQRRKTTPKWTSLSSTGWDNTCTITARDDWCQSTTSSWTGIGTGPRPNWYVTKPAETTGKFISVLFAVRIVKLSFVAFVLFIFQLESNRRVMDENGEFPPLELPDEDPTLDKENYGQLWDGLKIVQCIFINTLWKLTPFVNCTAWIQSQCLYGP